VEVPTTNAVPLLSSRTTTTAKPHREAGADRRPNAIEDSLTGALLDAEGLVERSLDRRAVPVAFRAPILTNWRRIRGRAGWMAAQVLRP
jgi:hypothetical protein